MTMDLHEAALAYHQHPRPGKISVELTKPTEDARDLALAYSPGVAAPVREIAKDPENAYRYTGKGNLVGVITDGTAILGLGDLGPLASKPVMEGKGVLFRRFAGIDVFDIEVDARDQDAFIETVASIAPTFGGINLEDIAAPACFEIERILSERCDIPVFHDDQHGTAIIAAAALLNALELTDRAIADARVVCVGAGAAGISTLRLLTALGVRAQNLLLVDSRGVVHADRTDLNAYKAEFAHAGPERTLADALAGADVSIGVSGPGILTPELLRSMAPAPIVFGLANPDPEIDPSLAHATRADVIMATGRSDHPNQVNNVLGFPFIFRGALDVRAARVNEEMKLAAVHAIAALAKEPVPAEVRAAYGGVELAFGPDCIIPKPLDPRLLGVVSAAVARAAVDSGVARRPYPSHYPLTSLEDIVYH
ncbi:malic enzyme-like NAD(P)-binding protein [Agrococcus jejuensis]|uniref:Malate dehydrogenase (Oxaloacetate-decarboxylating)(NADP+) n=1 Tax=Agrococcus jejuensis TaxID=399736 RepID=A0A1G8FT70_9MICO|nr:malic enzyme-like NAD(P)-binding protein [Agrococcus jejuensis]SDH85358.1 malate dehydrogenase (oxaloacetate-decarboxylating)(NADP+) [Agrococcus jejuensis]